MCYSTANSLKLKNRNYKLKVGVYSRSSGDQCNLSLQRHCQKSWADKNRYFTTTKFSETPPTVLIMKSYLEDNLSPTVFLSTTAQCTMRRAWRLAAGFVGGIRTTRWENSMIRGLEQKHLWLPTVLLFFDGLSLDHLRFLMSGGFLKKVLCQVNKEIMLKKWWNSTQKVQNDFYAKNRFF